jgi:hypothetical protein
MHQAELITMGQVAASLDRTCQTQARVGAGAWQEQEHGRPSLSANSKYKPIVQNCELAAAATQEQWQTMQAMKQIRT